MEVVDRLTEQQAGRVGVPADTLFPLWPPVRTRILSAAAASAASAASAAASGTAGATGSSGTAAAAAPAAAQDSVDELAAAAAARQAAALASMEEGSGVESKKTEPVMASVA